MITVRPAEYWHAAFVGHRLREWDRREIEMMGDAHGAQTFARCLTQSTEAWSAMEGSTPIAGWGFARDDMLLASTAYLWCLTSTGVERHRRDILRCSRAFVEDLRRRFLTLESLVHPGYEQSVRWCKWLGFQDAGQVVVNGETFTVLRLKGLDRCL